MDDEFEAEVQRAMARLRAEMGMDGAPADRAGKPRPPSSLPPTTAPPAAVPQYGRRASFPAAGGDETSVMRPAVSAVAAEGRDLLPPAASRDRAAEQAAYAAELSRQIEEKRAAKRAMLRGEAVEDVAAVPSILPAGDSRPRVSRRAAPAPGENAAAVVAAAAAASETEYVIRNGKVVPRRPPSSSAAATGIPSLPAARGTDVGGGGGSSGVSSAPRMYSPLEAVAQQHYQQQPAFAAGPGASLLASGDSSGPPLYDYAGAAAAAFEGGALGGGDAPAASAPPASAVASVLAAYRQQHALQQLQQRAAAAPPSGDLWYPAASDSGPSSVGRLSAGAGGRTAAAAAVLDDGGWGSGSPRDGGSGGGGGRADLGSTGSSLAMPANLDADTVRQAIQAGHSFSRYRKAAMTVEDASRAQARAKAQAETAAALAEQIAQRRAKQEIDAAHAAMVEAEEERRLERERQEIAARDAAEEASGKRSVGSVGAAATVAGARGMSSSGVLAGAPSSGSPVVGGRSPRPLHAVPAPGQAFGGGGGGGGGLDAMPADVSSLLDAAADSGASAALKRKARNAQLVAAAAARRAAEAAGGGASSSDIGGDGDGRPNALGGSPSRLHFGGGSPARPRMASPERQLPAAAARGGLPESPARMDESDVAGAAADAGASAALKRKAKNAQLVAAAAARREAAAAGLEEGGGGRHSGADGGGSSLAALAEPLAYEAPTSDAAASAARYGSYAGGVVDAGGDSADSSSAYLERGGGGRTRFPDDSAAAYAADVDRWAAPYGDRSAARISQSEMDPGLPPQHRRRIAASAGSRPAYAGPHAHGIASGMHASFASEGSAFDGAYETPGGYGSYVDDSLGSAPTAAALLTPQERAMLLQLETVVNKLKRAGSAPVGGRRADPRGSASSAAFYGAPAGGLASFGSGGGGGGLHEDELMRMMAARQQLSQQPYLMPPAAGPFRGQLYGGGIAAFGGDPADAGTPLADNPLRAAGRRLSGAGLAGMGVLDAGAFPDSSLMSAPSDDLRMVGHGRPLTAQLPLRGPVAAGGSGRAVLFPQPVPLASSLPSAVGAVGAALAGFPIVEPSLDSTSQLGTSTAGIGVSSGMGAGVGSIDSVVGGGIRSSAVLEQSLDSSTLLLPMETSSPHASAVRASIRASYATLMPGLPTIGEDVLLGGPTTTTVRIPAGVDAAAASTAAALRTSFVSDDGLQQHTPSAARAASVSPLRGVGASRSPRADLGASTPGPFAPLSPQEHAERGSLSPSMVDRAAGAQSARSRTEQNRLQHEREWANIAFASSTDASEYGSDGRQPGSAAANGIGRSPRRSSRAPMFVGSAGAAETSTSAATAATSTSKAGDRSKTSTTVAATAALTAVDEAAKGLAAEESAGTDNKPPAVVVSPSSMPSKPGVGGSAATSVVGALAPVGVRTPVRAGSASVIRQPGASRPGADAGAAAPTSVSAAVYAVDSPGASSPPPAPARVVHHAAVSAADNAVATAATAKPTMGVGSATLDATISGATGALSAAAGILGNTTASSTGLSSPRAHEISMAEIRDALEAAEAEQRQAPHAGVTASTAAAAAGPGRDTLARSSSTGSDSGRRYVSAGLAGPVSGLYSPTKLNRATRPISAVPSASPARELRPLFPSPTSGTAAGADVTHDANALVRPQSAASDVAVTSLWAAGGLAASGDRTSTIAALKASGGAAPAGTASPIAADDSAEAAPSSAAPAASTTAAGSWGLTDAEVSLHKRRLLAFYTVHAPAKAHNETIETAWNLFGPRVWTELERKYKGKTAGFRPSVAAA